MDTHLTLEQPLHTYIFNKSLYIFAVLREYKGVRLGDVGAPHNHTATTHGMPESLKDVSLLLEIISAWWDFHDFDANGNEAAETGNQEVNDRIIWAADVMKETNSHPPALVETPNVRAINDGIQAQLAEPIEISDSDSD